MERLCLSLLLAPFFGLISVGSSAVPCNTLQEVSLGTESMLIGPQISKFGRIILYTLDNNGVFHRCTASFTPQFGDITYSVLKNGILVPTSGPYSIQYEINKKGDLIPKPGNTCIYKSDKVAFYLRGVRKMLIPVDIFYSGDKVHYVYDKNHMIFEEPLDKSNINFSKPGFVGKPMSLKLKPDSNIVVPDKSCSGDVILFLLKSNGVFARNPPDEYLPNGMALKYELKKDGSLTPDVSKSPEGLKLKYLTTENGNLAPCDSNSHTLTTTTETIQSYILGEGGVLAPVSEVTGINKSINYFFDGKLIHSSNQFQQVYTNSTVVYLLEKNREISSDSDLKQVNLGPNFSCVSKKISKREVRKINSGESEEFQQRRPSVKPCCTFAYDDKGKRIPLEPFVTECGKIALYKLTCKGHLKRMDAHEEPDWGFEVHFRLLENCILSPTMKNNGRICLKYSLQKNGNLAPVRHQKFTFKKAPASILYYVLGKNKQLLPVRLNILKSHHLEIYYQDCLIHTLPPECAKIYDVFTTCYAPLYAYLNGRIIIIYADPVPKPCSGSTWNNPNKSGDTIEYPCKNLYLVGPNNTKMRIEPEMNHNGVPVVYEMDWNGVCHKSPKDENKNLVLKSYKLLKECILMPTNETNCYIYLVDKKGDMIPYCYPDSKLRAPFCLTVKYVLCFLGLLLPVLVEAPGDHIRFSYENNVIYSKKAYTLDEIIEFAEDCSCEEIKYHKEKDGSLVYYERIGECFKRHPCQQLEDYVIHNLGYMKILPCGTLIPQTYPDPTSNTVKFQIEENGDLCIVSCTGEKPACSHYLLSENKSLIPVEVITKDGYHRFYKDGKRIGKQKIDKWELESSTQPSTPFGADPMGIFKDPKPEKNNGKDPHHLTIPINDGKPKKKWEEFDEKKCEQIRKTIKDMMGKGGMDKMELEMSDNVMEELYKMVCSCANAKNKRELLKRYQRHLSSRHGPPPSMEHEEDDEVC